MSAGDRGQGTGDRTRVAWLLPPASCLLAVLLLTLALTRPAPQTIDVGAPGDAYFLANFYPAEAEGPATYRWSAPGARLLIPATSQGALAVTMRLRGAPFAQPQDLQLSLGRSPQSTLAFGADTRWRVYRLLLPPGDMGWPSAGQAPLELTAPPVSPGPEDPRPLGVALDHVRLRALGPTPLGPALALALLIAWGVGLVVY